MDLISLLAESYIFHIYIAHVTIHHLMKRRAGMQRLVHEHFTDAHPRCNAGCPGTMLKTLQNISEIVVSALQHCDNNPTSTSAATSKNLASNMGCSEVAMGWLPRAGKSL